MATEKAKSSAKKQASNKVMDVAKPGKTAPSATSKPIIVGHKSMMKQDPMMSEKPAKSSDDGDKIAVNRGTKVVAPLTLKVVDTSEEKLATAPVLKETSAEEPAIQSAAAPAEPEEVPGAAEVPATPEVETPETPEEELAPAASEEAEPESTSDEASEVDAVAEQVGSGKKKDSQETEEEKQKRENVEKLIADKKYFVPTGQVTRKRRTRWTIFLLIVLIAAAGFIFAVDAEVIDVGVDLPFDIVKT